MTTRTYTHAEDPRIAVGTRVKFTELDDPREAEPKWYSGLADGNGTVTRDDGSLEAPYQITLDNEYPNALFPLIPDTTVLADFDELEILP